MKKIALLTTAIIGFTATALFASERPTEIRFSRPLAMGGAFTALADDDNIFAYNPAGLVQRTGSQFTLLNITGGVAKDTKTFLDFLKDNKDELNNWGDDPIKDQELTNKIVHDISKLDPRIYAAADLFSYLSGPSFWGAHLGFGVQGVLDSSFKLEPGVFEPAISFDVNNDIVVPVTVARRWNAPLLPGTLGIGLTGKYLHRAQTKQERVNVTQLDDVDSPPIAQGAGYGSDLGFLYQPTDRTNVGVMVQDFLGTKMHFDAEPGKGGFQGYNERDTVIRPQTNVGVAMTPKSLFWLLPTGDRWTFSADLRDIRAEDQHILFQEGFNDILGDDFGTHAYVGTEFRYWFLRFRGGAYQGYPSFGLGLDIPVLKLDFAYYGREIGAQAGDRRQDNYTASLSLSFGSGNVEARERISKGKEKSKQQNAAEPTESNTNTAPAAEPTTPETTPQ